MAPKLKSVVRLDSMPLKQTYFTEEGYLRDRPVLTSVGIFEYLNPDGSVRRELRLPEEVFAESSLASYKGKPIIITHDAGLIDKDNVSEEQIGTILSEGIQSGEDVRADIVIHDTDAMKKCKLKELSLGYNLDLDETPGEWNGQHYDAIQRNIFINHLALVREARAGDQARLNIDSRSSNTLQGGKAMSRAKTKKTRRSDGVLSPEELTKAIEQYKALRAKKDCKRDEEDPTASDKKVVSTPPPMMGTETKDADDFPQKPGDDAAPEDKVKFAKDRKGRRDTEGEPEDLDKANGVIAQQDEDIDYLFDIIDSLLAEREFNSTKKDADDEETEDPDVAEDADEEIDPDDETATDADEDTTEEDLTEDEDDEEEDLTEDEDDEEQEENLDDEDEDIPTLKKGEVNTDSIDRIVRQRVKIGMVGRALNLDGLENMKIKSAKKAVIRAVRPGIRLDGKSNAYINAMFDMAVEEAQTRTRKGTAYQKKQMFNADSRAKKSNGESANSARQRMIARHQKKEG